MKDVVFKSLFYVYRYGEYTKSKVVSLIYGFLFGRIINELSLPYAKIQDLLYGLFSLQKFPNFFIWLAIILLLFYYIFLPFIGYHVNKIKNDKWNSFLERFQENVIEIQRAPDLEKGWNIGEIKINLESNPFEWEFFWEGFQKNVHLGEGCFLNINNLEKDMQEYSKDYETWKKSKSFDKEKLHDDNIKVSLLNIPYAYTDTPTLILKLGCVLYSQVLFFQNILQNTLDEKYLNKRYVEIIRCFFKNINTIGGLTDFFFPHSLCVHSVVETQDDFVLFPRRSSNTRHYSNSWSCSLEEQIDYEKDVKVIENLSSNISVDMGCILLFTVNRMLKEELGLQTWVDVNKKIIYLDDSDKKTVEVVFLSVFLEKDIFNVALCCYIKLPLKMSDLQEIIIKHQTDKEFCEIKYVENKVQNISAFFDEKKELHPTAKYRAYICLLRKYGSRELEREFFKMN